ncbi:acyl carrier protein [Pseudomonas syringae pv. actinidiae]|uniref:Acyl carrier protein n=2 Tax=Pseudomonas syringae group TaxID=136849 RepID=A0A261WAD3_9PSED|nr:hypothetical protein B1R35_11020 [Pseudomonas syringae pv. actinidiae]AVB21257.1 acyl carrier protein [Pseudomonas avellanae]AYL82208.1 acyl carrier protein [Pseudomonas syringae pv. actinidiae str. Shaanxi_M228]POP87401.1 acyl carrier protein [Pseudomonas amygdali pv. morsprunorum]AQX66862.1 hypothetical protein B1F85_24920 [Pseudomonas syringae pv. actinidiae]
MVRLLQSCYQVQALPAQTVIQQLVVSGSREMEDKVLRLIEEAMEADEGSLSKGQNLDWDSIAVVTFMSLADEHLGKSLSANRLNACKSVDDVISLVTE